MQLVSNFLKYERKRLCLFLLYYMAGIPASLAQDFYGLLNDAMDQPIIERFSLTDLSQSHLKCSTGYAYQDYLREKSPGLGTQTISGNIATIDVEAINAWKHIEYGFFLQVQDQFESYTSLDTGRIINSDYQQEGRNYNIQLAVGNEGSMWGLGMERKNQVIRAPIVINKYPESEDSQMNRYFLDWLEPSFGSHVDVHGNTDLTGFLTFASLPLGAHRILQLTYKSTENRFAPNIDYVNQSNIHELQGDRRLTLDGTNYNQLLQIGLENRRNTLKPSLTIQRAKADMTIINLLPDGIIDDFPELGGLDFSRGGVAFDLEQRRKNLDIGLGFGYSQWEANTSMTTPVLGRYWFVPIAHAAHFKISGESYSQHLNFNTKLINQRIKLDLDLAYQHAFFNLKMVGDAELEFNIHSVAIDDPYQFHLHILSIGLPISYTYHSFTFSYQMKQLVPWFKRVDHSRIHFQGDRSRNSDVRGGGQHMLILSYTLS